MKFCNYIARVVAPKHATNSASDVEEAIVVCLMLFHETAPLSKRKIYPDVDLPMLRYPAKSEDEYSITSM